MVSVHCLGASQEVGRSAFLLETDKRLLLDYGIKIFGKNGQAEFPADFNEQLDAAIISHAHMDHIGFLPNLYNFSKVPWIGTPPTRDLGEVLLADSMKIMGPKLPFDQSHYIRALKSWVSAPYKKRMDIGETAITFFDAGHISGSAMVQLDYGGKRILYSGDIKLQETHLHKGAQYKDEVDVLFVESTYRDREHPDRKIAEKKLMQEIHDTVKAGGTVLFPAFALGRTQELIRIIRSFDRKVPIYVDGMGRTMTSIYLKHGEYIKDVEGFRRDVKTVHMIRNPRERYAAVENPGVIISSAGMLEGGPALWYLTNMNKDSKIIFTGYCVQGTNGWRLMTEGRVVLDGNELEVDLPVEYIDFSAHAGRSELLEFIKRTNPGKIITVHGDSTQEFADELKQDFGFDAVGPKIGDTVEL